MSLGYLDDEENPPIEGPPEPGSAEDFIAGVNSQPLAAPVAPEISDETAWPPAVPAEAPGMVPPAAPPPTLPGAPGAPIQPPPGPNDAAPPARGSIADVTGAADTAEKARATSDQAQIDLMAAGQPANAQMADLAREKRDNALLQQADNEEQKAKYDSADAEAEKQIAAAQEQKRNFKFKDFWADKSTARRVGSAIAVAFGAYGAAMTHTQNYALEILNKEMDDDHRRQVDDLQRLNDNEVMARTGLTDARAARVRALQDIGLKAADADKVIAAKADEVAAISRDDQQKAALTAFAAKLRQDAADKTLQTRIGLRNAILAGQAGELKNANLAAQTRLLNAKAGKIGRAGGGAGANANLSAISSAAEEGKTLKDLTAMPEARGVKFETLKKIYDEGQKVAGSGQEERKASLHALDKLPGEFKTDLAESGVVAGQGGAKGLLPTNRSLQKLLHAVDSDNPLSAKEAFLAFDSAARGGSATQGSIDALTKTLGGTEVQFKNWLEGKSSGGLSKEAKTRFRDAIAEAISTNIAAAGDSHQQLAEKYYAPDYYQLKQHVEGQMGVFGGFRDAEGKPVFQVKRDAGAPGVDRTTGKKLASSARPAGPVASGVDQEALAYYKAQTAAGKPVPPNVINGLRAKGLIE